MAADEPLIGMSRTYRSPRAAMLLEEIEMSKVTKLALAEEGSKVQNEFQADQGLAEQYLAAAQTQELYALYQKRCQQLDDMGKTLATMSEMYAGKSGNAFPVSYTPDAVKSMERVALAAIALAEAVAGKQKTK